jgi:heat shock protein HslJ
MQREVVAGLGALMLLAACASRGGAPSNAPADSAPDPADIVGAWVLAQGTGPDGPIAIPDGMRITLLLDRPQAGGEACNDYGVDVRQSGVRVDLSIGSSTDMACAEPIMTAEAAYYAAIEAVEHAERRDADTLVLLGADGTELVFSLLPDAPAAELVGTNWRLDSLIDGGIAAAPMGEPTLEFGEGGTLAATTGCRDLMGDGLRAVGDQLVMETFGATDASVECPGAIGEQDSHVVEVLGDGFIVELEGDTLTLRDPSGLGLVYRAAE